MFTSLIGIVKSVVRQITGKGGNMVDFVLKLSTYVPEIIKSITTVLDMKKSDGFISSEEYKVLIDEALQAFDDETGADGISLFKSQNSIELAHEEDALDHFKEFIRFTLYRQYGVNITN